MEGTYWFPAECLLPWLCPAWGVRQVYLHPSCEHGERAGVEADAVNSQIATCIADSIRDHHLDFVGISETGKRDFSVSLLIRLAGGVDFTWISRPPRGRSGGLLLGVRKDTMEVLSSSDGEFHIKLHIRNKADNFTWSLVTVYGAAQNEHKPDFLQNKIHILLS